MQHQVVCVVSGARKRGLNHAAPHPPPPQHTCPQTTTHFVSQRPTGVRPVLCYSSAGYSKTAVRRKSRRIESRTDENSEPQAHAKQAHAHAQREQTHAHTRKQTKHTRPHLGALLRGPAEQRRWDEEWVLLGIWHLIQKAPRALGQLQATVRQMVGIRWGAHCHEEICLGGAYRGTRIARDRHECQSNITWEHTMLWCTYARSLTHPQHATQRS